MSRYRVEEPIPTSTTAHIYGPDGQVIGQIPEKLQCDFDYGDVFNDGKEAQ